MPTDLSTATRPRHRRWAATLSALAALLLLIVLATPAQAATQKPRPTYWGAWIGDQLTGEKAPWDMSAVTKFESLVGKGPSLLQMATPFADCNVSPCRLFSFPTPQLQNIRGYGAIPVLSWSSSAIPEQADQSPFRLANIASGSYDPYIRGFAESAAAWGQPFFLRFNWEMNGNWFPWSEGLNGNSPGQYVAAWRHVHDVFRSVGAGNATWLWCPFADPSGKFGKIGRLYPGDRYVDWTCMDGYNWASNPTNPHPWRSFDEIFASTYKKLTRHIAPKKPIMLGEIASTGSGKAKATWIRKMFKSLATKYRRVRGLIWFDQIDRRIDWPIESTPQATRAFARGIRSRSYLANTHGGLAGAPIRPPR